MKGKRYSLCMSVDTSGNIYYILKEKSIKSENYNGTGTPRQLYIL